MRPQAIQDDVEWINAQAFEYDREQYELREWWCRGGQEQVPQQLDLPLDEPPQPKKYYPF